MLRDAWALTVGTLTVLRVRPPAVVDRRRALVAVLLAPGAVIPLGAALAGIAWVVHLVGWPPALAALLGLSAGAWGTRALHLDGLADTADGLTASYDRTRSLEVMRSGSSGPAGVVAIVLTLGVQATGLVAVLESSRPVAAAVLAGVALCVSRAALLVCCARGVPAARTDGLGAVFTGTVPAWVVIVGWLVIAALLSALGGWAGLAWWRGALAVVLAAVAVVALVARAVHRLGGVTGDVFGAAIELAFAALLVGLA